ncbi:hypothetical protein ACVJMZ_003865 [Sinorhizobium medicae]
MIGTDLICLRLWVRAIPPFAGHHHIDDQKIEINAYQLAPGLVGIGCRRYAKPLLDQIAVEQVANAPVVVDDQEMCRIVGDCRLCHHRSVPSLPAKPDPT